MATARVRVLEEREQLSIQRPDRLILVAEAIRRDFIIEDINSITGIDNFFLREINEIINVEKLLVKSQGTLDLTLITKAKKIGFSNTHIASLIKKDVDDIYDLLNKNGAKNVFKRVDTCGNEFDSSTAYLYSSFGEDINLFSCEARPSNKEKIIILGSGPNRIGQG